MSAEFLQQNVDALESFAVVLERLCSKCFDLPLRSIAIYHDPSGTAIGKSTDLGPLLLFDQMHFWPEWNRYNRRTSRCHIKSFLTCSITAFNANGGIYCNIRYYYGLHYSKGKPQSKECYSYWFITLCHELAHNLVSGHTKDHAFYTESYASLYLPKLIGLL